MTHEFPDITFFAKKVWKTILDHEHLQNTFTKKRTFLNH